MLCALLAVLAQAVPVSAPPLTVQAAVALAREHNPEIEEARAAIDAARASLNAARSVYRPAFEPRFAGALGGDFANQQYGAELSQRFPSGTRLSASISSMSSRNQLGTYYYGETSFSLAQSIFGSRDQSHREVGVAARTIDDATLRERSVEARVAVDVAAACYAIASGRLMSNAADKAMTRYKELLAVSEAKLAIGQVSQLDVLRAQRLVREAASRLDDARANEEDARDALRALLGGAVAADVDVAVDVPDAVGIAPVETIVASALARSPEIEAARGRVADAERRAAEAHAPKLPRVDVTLSLTRRDTGATLRSSLSSDRFHLIPFVQLAMPDRGREIADAAATFELARVRRELKAAELKIETDVRRLVRQEARLANNLRDAIDGVAFAERQVDVARERFTRGLSNNLDLVGAESELLEAENRRFTTAASLAVIRLQIRAASGDLDFPGGGR